MVEAPGTAPGSEWFISQVIYRHSWRTSPFNIGSIRRKSKNFEPLSLLIYDRNFEDDVT